MRYLLSKNHLFSKAGIPPPAVRSLAPVAAVETGHSIIPNQNILALFCPSHVRRIMLSRCKKPWMGEETSCAIAYQRLISTRFFALYFCFCSRTPLMQAARYLQATMLCGSLSLTTCGSLRSRDLSLAFLPI